MAWIVQGFDEDYRAIRHGAALVDLSGAGLLLVAGPGAAATLQQLHTRDISYLSYESSTMGLFLDEGGGVLDIATVYKVEDGFWVETAIGNGSAVRSHIEANAEPGTTVTPVDAAVYAVEGPMAWAVLDDVLDEPASGLPFQGVRPTRAAGHDVTISRTGFTGEFGAKVIVPTASTAAVWDALAERATEVGHAALEAAMLEVRQPVLHRERDDAPSVGEAAYNWFVDLEKDEFLGRAAAVASITEPAARRTICFVTDATVEPGFEVATSDRPVGAVVSCAFSPSLGRHCGIARMAAEVAASGLVLGVRTAAGLEPIETVSSPMVVPSSWHLLALTE